MSSSSVCSAASLHQVEAAWAPGPSSLLRAKLAYVLGRTGQIFNGHYANINLLQVWFSDACERASKDAMQAEYTADPELVVMADPSFDAFRADSAQCHDCGRISMPGRVFRSGQVQVVQNLRVLPACLHPRSRLGGDLSDRVAEALYLPVYDLSEPSAGPAAVLEALLSSRAADSMLVANLMSFMGSQLAAVQLSIASPLPQPVLPSTLAGRRARPQVELSDSEDEEQDAAWPAPRRPAAKQPRRAAYEPPATPARHPAMHPGLALPPAAPACAAAAACKPPPPPPASAAPTCSADSACTEVASCAAFPRPQARPVASAATSPPELGRDYEADAQCECMGPPRSKRPRAASPARSAPAGMRRARSVPRSLADMGDAGAY